MEVDQAININTVGPVFSLCSLIIAVVSFQLHCKFNNCICANCTQGWAINRISLEIKSLRTIEKLAIRNYQILTIKTGPTVAIKGSNFWHNNLHLVTQLVISQLQHCKAKPQIIEVHRNGQKSAVVYNCRYDMGYKIHSFNFTNTRCTQHYYNHY